MPLEKTYRRAVSSVLLATILVCAPAWAGVCRVTTAGTGFNDGSSWAVPVSLQQALTASGICTEIWVKKGVYKPTTGGNTGISFGIADGVEVYGGFAGTETARDQRNPTANLTVLSGDIDNNDTTDANGVDADASHIAGANSLHVVTMSLTTSSTVLDGFTVTGGHAPGNGAADTFVGGGLLCGDCTSTLSRLIFSGNSASKKGGAFYVGNGSPADDGPELSDIMFRGNQAGDDGGAVSINTFNAYTIRFSDIAFSGNQAFAGGAMSVSASAATTLALTNVAFSDNHAHGGGALYQGGESHTTFTNVTFSANVADGSGGALFLDNSLTNADVALTNVTFNANQASTEFGGAIYSNRQAGNVLALRNVILWGDVAPLGQGPEIAYASNSAVAAIDHSIVKGSGGSGAGWHAGFGTDGGGNLDADPRLGVLAYNHGATQTLVPGPGSPVIDAGNGTGCPGGDQRGIIRPQGAACDIGAVETFVVDLIGHKGTEACWSKAVTKSSFLGLVGSNVEGNTACIPPFAFQFFNGSTFVIYNVCYTAACPGGNVGCPITTHAGAFSDGGDFGAGQFSATGTADNLTLAGVSGFGTCNYNASGITTSYTSDYVFTDDGNHGDYAALLNQFTAAPTNAVLGGSGSDPNCGASVPYFYAYFYGFATVGMSAGLKQKLQSPTLGKSVCPAQ